MRQRAAIALAVTLIAAALLVGFSLPAQALSSAAQEFVSISRELEPVQCEKRRLRRQMALAEIEQRPADLKTLRERFAALNKDKKVARLERRLAELEPQVSRSSDPEDLATISRQQREAFYRCE